jgi:hypothetical protein
MVEYSNCGIVLLALTFGLEQLGCTYCCIEEFIVCGEPIDCNATVGNVVYIVIGIIMILWAVLIGICLYMHYCIGKN